MTLPTTHPSIPDDEVDVRALIRTLIRDWRLIAIATVVAGLVGLVMVFLWPPEYQATALVTVVQPRYSLELEGVRREAAPALRSYTDLAASDAVLLQVQQTVRSETSAELPSLEELRDRLQITASPDGTLLRLTAKDSDAGNATRLANAWAQAIVFAVQDVYGPGSTLIARYEDEVQGAQNTLAETEKQLANFQTVNQAPVISTTLISLQQNLGVLLSRRFEVEQLLNDARDLRTRLQAYAPTASLSSSDELVVLLLNARATSGGKVELQFQLNGSVAATPKLAGDAVVQLDELIQSLEIRSSDLSQQATALQPEILEVQGQLARVQAEESQLLRARELAENQYLGLDEKVREVQVAIQEAANLARVVSAASSPSRSNGSTRWPILGGITTTGCVLAICWVLARAWWRDDNRA